MPELPEVETIRKYLESKVLNNKIKKIILFLDKSLKTGDKKDIDNLKDQKIVSLERKAKYLIIKTEKNTIFFHLRLEGKFLIEDSKNIDKKHAILFIETNNEKTIGFYDFRKFATIDIFNNLDIEKINNFYKKTGPEPWDVKFNDFEKAILKSSLAIKTLLLNQKIISGIGNIYVDEILYSCKVMPSRLSKNLNSNEIKCILNNSKSILKESIKNNGSSIRTYSVDGLKGNFQNLLKVHTKLGSKCGPNSYVAKMKVNGRGTYYCPGVQK